MISFLRLKNFKAFEDQGLDLKNLTLLSGLNSTGKSSVLQALLLLRQSYKQDLLPEIGLALNGDLVCIGTAQDALFEDAKENSIGLELIWKDGNQGAWLFNYNPEADVLAITSPPTVLIYINPVFSMITFTTYKQNGLVLEHTLRYQIFKYDSTNNSELKANTLHTLYLFIEIKIFPMLISATQRQFHLI
jgi:hypothetical protein